MKTSTVMPVSCVHKLSEIAKHLNNNRGYINTNVGFFSGSLGPFLFLYAYSSLVESKSYAAVCGEILQATISRAVSSSQSSVRELVELGLIIRSLKQQKLLTGEINYLLKKIDTELVMYSRELIVRKLFDPFIGYLPIANYFLSRGKQRSIDDILKTFIDAILDSQEKSDSGYYWRSFILNNNQIYTGWSHGIASIIAFLTKVVARGITYRIHEVKLSLAQASNYLMHNKNTIGRNFYPDVIDQQEPSNILNLCYGDLGICYFLLKSAKTLENGAVYQKILSQLIAAAQRRTPDLCGIHDASVIFGTSGTTMFFAHMYRMTRKSVFRKAAEYWVAEGEKLCQNSDAVAGYKPYYNKRISTTYNSLLEGVSGYGLAMIDYYYNSVGLLKLIGY